MEVIYDYQDRSHVGLEKPSKQVVGYRSLLEGMRMPFERHYVRDLDAIRLWMMRRCCTPTPGTPRGY